MHQRTIDLPVSPYCLRIKGYTYDGNFDGEMFPTYVVMAGPTTPVFIPEYFDQVTHKHESTCIHAKFTSISCRLRGITGVEPFSDTKGLAYAYSREGLPSRYKYLNFEYYQGSKIVPDWESGVVIVTKSWVYHRKSDNHYSTHTEEWKYHTKDYRLGINRCWVHSYSRSANYDGENSLYYISAEWHDDGYKEFGDHGDAIFGQPVSPAMYLKFNEPGWVKGSYELPAPLRALCLEASKQALGQIPAYADNNIANIVETFGTVVSLLSEGVQFAWKGIGNLADLWLGYRYSYNTTKSDTQQAIAALSRRAWFSYFHDARIDGDASASIEGVDVHCHLKAYCRKRSSDLLSAIRLRLWEYGLLPSKYRLWDLIPFSFVADWILNWGDSLKDEEDLSVLSHGYIFVDSSYSIKYTVRDELSDVQCYTRWESAPIFYADYNLHLDSHRPIKFNTVGKRAADTAALTWGYTTISKRMW